MSRRLLQRIALGILATAAVAGVIAVAGGYNVGASSGHLPGITTLFHWTLHNSVTLRAGRQQATPQPRIPVSGAGHYDLVCRACHGAPGEPVPESLRHMLPAPPHISDALGHWDEDELFWIVKHGIKMTAMPAWPTQARDDEVREVVQFLQRLPELDAPGYRQATGRPRRQEETDAESSPLLARCAACHGTDGLGRSGSSVPVIAGLGETYLARSLEAYRHGTRASGFMQAQASQLGPEEIRDLARHYAAQRRPDPDYGARPPDRGRRIARQGDRDQRVPPCAGCHGPGAAPGYPTLDGQRADYLRRQLELFRDGTRGGTRFASIMTFAVRHLSDADIAAVAAYYASQHPEG